MNTAMITNVLAAAEVSYGEKVLNGLIVVAVGMLAVFAVLAILWGVLALFKVFFYDMPEKKKAALKAKNENEKLAASDNAAAVEGASAPAPESAPDDTQLIAVITAAIAAYTAESGKTALPFRVVSYKRVRGACGWNGADENESI